eukprot:scaffold51615_cov36-Tisochrysis_lutea.AAC.2
MGAVSPIRQPLDTFVDWFLSWRVPIPSIVTAPCSPLRQSLCKPLVAMGWRAKVAGATVECQLPEPGASCQPSLPCFHTGVSFHRSRPSILSAAADSPPAPRGDGETASAERARHGSYIRFICKRVTVVHTQE